MQNNILKTKSKSVKLGVAGAAFAAALLAPSVAKADSYTVQSGDTLSKIASAHNTTVDYLASVNGISDIHFITVGQTIELDAVEASAPAATTTTSSYSSSLSSSDAAAKETIAQRESSGSYTAQNGQYYGRYQLTSSYLNGDLSPENQERVADAYVASRYGSWSAALAFWNANGWY